MKKYFPAIFDPDNLLRSPIWPTKLGMDFDQTCVQKMVLKHEKSMFLIRKSDNKKRKRKSLRTLES